MSDSTTILLHYPKRMPMTLAERLVSHYNTTSITDLRNAVPHFWASMTVDSQAFCGFFELVKRKEAMRP